MWPRLGRLLGEQCKEALWGFLGARQGAQRWVLRAER